MRTTIDIPLPLYRRLKAEAAARGATVKALVLEGVEQALSGQAGAARRGEWPVIASVTPGTVELTNERIYDAIAFP